jgi:murein DD-endopeptidase MepM/ murein hydrolase activator NlpD
VTQPKSNRPQAVETSASGPGWLSITAWGITAAMVVLLVYVLVIRFGGPNPGASIAAANAPLDLPPAPSNVILPVFEPAKHISAVMREANNRTIIPTRPREQAVIYTVQMGDSVFGIAQTFNLKPETVLWANFAILNDDPHMISVDQELYIPPTDGVLYIWKEGDTINNIAASFRSDPEAILLYPGNRLDIANPQIEPDQPIMIPGGSREFRAWVVPTIPRGPAGVNTRVLGPGACDTSTGGAFGSGTFVWPTINRTLSGNDYWAGHLAIDIAANTGDPVYSTDSGLVVYAGPISGGYGNMVMVDHGNGYQTLYAHLSAWTVNCGASVGQGSLIGRSGSTGRSTGPHLHFEVRYLGGFINPWHVLP